MIKVVTTGSFKNAEAFLKRVQQVNIPGLLARYGQEGVNALAAATPVETGIAQHSWTFEVEAKGGLYTISWLNTDIENGFNVVIALQYGHGTGTGGWVQGRDFINPAIRPIFDKIADEVWKAVTTL